MLALSALLVTRRVIRDLGVEKGVFSSKVRSTFASSASATRLTSDSVDLLSPLYRREMTGCLVPIRLAS